MDQTIIAGIGNIYSDEILWHVGILPIRSVKDLTRLDAQKILTATRRILKQSILVGGDSKSDYRNIFGERGGFQHKHRAYHMHKKACLKSGCDGILVRMKLGGRSAHYCPVHQT